MISYFVREHQYVNGDTATHCLHCNSRSGLGFYFTMRCGVRFNEKGFRDYLEFNNIGFTEKKGQRVYTRRFTSEVIAERELLKRFFDACDFSETIATLEAPKYFDENRT